MPPSELERTEALMRREAYRRAGAQARSLGVPRNKNPFQRPAVNESEQEMLAVLASHWRDGWDTWQPPRPQRGPQRLPESAKKGPPG